MENIEKESFNYTYSAKEQEEIKAIRNKYTATDEQEDKMTQLRRLDASVTKKASIYSLAFGIIGVLILGIGMSLAMTDIGKVIGIFQNMSMLIGIIIGVIGIALVCVAYPVYNRIVKKEREKIAPKILHLTDELIK